MSLYLVSILDFLRSYPMSVRDVIDIALVAFIAYRFLLLMRGTRGVQMTFGIIVLVTLYFATRYYRLTTVQWLLTNVLTYIVFGVIVLYQAEIRRGLAGIGMRSLLGFRAKRGADGFDEIILAATTLASKRIGALVVLERNIGLRNYAESGITLEAVLTYDLLVTIFSPNTPLHDGAVISPPGLPEVENVGLVGGLIGGSFPEWKANVQVRYQWTSMTAGVQWRYVDSMRDANPDLDYPIPSYDYLDLFATYAFDAGALDGLTFRAGIENLTDEEPPLLPSQVQANTDPSQYDVLGRRYYFNVSYRF